MYLTKICPVIIFYPCLGKASCSAREGFSGRHQTEDVKAGLTVDEDDPGDRYFTEEEIEASMKGIRKSLKD